MSRPRPFDLRGLLCTPLFALFALQGTADAERGPSPAEKLDMEYALQNVLQLVPIDWYVYYPPIITVPDDYPSISEALLHAASTNQRILVKESPFGYYIDNVVIDASDFTGLTIEGECGVLPEVRSSATYGQPVFHIVNDENVPSTITIRNLTISGA